MNRVDYLRQERSTPHVLFHRFRLLYRRGANKDVFAFFEGNDDISYYMPEIRRLNRSKGKIIFIKCDGKKNIIELYNKVRKKVDNKHRTLFFIDRDLDEILRIKLPNYENFYVTEFYSIENYLVNEDVLRIIWTDIYNLSDTEDARFPIILKKYNTCINKFNLAVKPVMACIINERKSGGTLNLQNVKLDKVVSFTNRFDVERKKDGLNYFFKTCGIHSSVQITKNIRSIVRGLKSLNAKQYIRGKFEMWFFVKFINKVTEIVKTKTKKHKAVKVRLNLNESNAVKILASKCVYPYSLTNFLNYNLSRI